jgi:putative transport protein
MLIVVGMATTAVSLLVGFLFGRYVLQINWVLLSGAICGAMTSTPGLGAAIDATGRNEAAGGYGATYPLGLLCKVVLVLLLQRLPL